MRYKIDPMNIVQDALPALYLLNKNQQDALFYSQFISKIDLYMVQAGLLLVISRYFPVYTAVGMCHTLC
jgi:hypothetical protein